MEKEDITLLAQLLTGMKDALDKIEEAQRRNDSENFLLVKKEMLGFQKQIAKRL